MPTADNLTAEQAIEALRAGETVRVVVGPSPDHPTLRVALEDGCVMSESIAGWSAGVVEPVCFADSDYLHGFFANRYSVTLEPTPKHNDTTDDTTTDRED